MPEDERTRHDELLIGAAHPAVERLVARDLEGRDGKAERRCGVSDLLRRRVQHVVATRCPQFANRLVPELGIGLVPHGHVAIDDVGGIVRRLVHSRSVSAAARTSNSLEGMDFRVGDSYDELVTVAAEPSRFACELRHWRRTRHWSQLELAVRAGTTQRHLSFIEQGRSRPGRAIVLRLAESLGLSLRERNRLLLAAGYAPVFPESRLDDPDLRPVREVLDRVLDGHLPCPAVVTRPYGEVVAANRALAVLTGGAVPELLEPPVNVLRVALHPDGMGRRVENLAEWGRHIIDSLRVQASRSPDDRLDAFITELESYVPAFNPGPGHVGFAVPLRLHTDDGELHLITTLTSFATATDVTLAELHLEAFLPADQGTATILQRRAAMALS
jgi:transcriptional regulator with XRE-family HTH domain